MDKPKVIRNLTSILLVAGMTGCAEWSGEKEFIFPEIGALCIGLWVVNKHVWKVRRWQIPVLFTWAALVGVCIVRYLPCPLPIQMETGFILVALTLMLADASITPALSGCMLPVLMGTDSWLYPIVVLVSTSILTAGQWWMERCHIRQVVDEPLQFSVPPSRTRILLRWLWLMLILAPILIAGSYFDVKFIMVPPLIVTLVEITNSASGFRKRPIWTWLILMLGAVLGTLTEGVMHQLGGAPQTLCATVAISAMLFIFDRQGKYFAPAAAICLVPMLLPVEAVPYYPLYVAIGSAYFIGCGTLSVPD